MLDEAIQISGYAGKISIGMDVAASEFFKEHDGHKKYDLDFKNPQSDPTGWLSGEALLGVYQDMVAKYPIVSIEDPFDQDDWSAWSDMTSKTDIQVCSGIFCFVNFIKIL